MKDTKRIALVHDFLFTYGGAERVLSVFHKLYPEAPIYTLLADPKVIAKHFPKATIITSPLQKSWLHRWPPLLLGRMPQAVESFDLNGFDIVLSSSGAFSHGVITGPETTHISYCHTPMRYAWDWHNEYLKERKLNGLVSQLLVRSLLSRLRIWDKVSSSRVDRFLANSGVVADRIRTFYRQEATVIYPPINTDYFDYAKLDLKETDKPYAVSASRLTPNKRIDLVIKACAQVGMPLRIVGDGAQRAELQAIAKKAGGDITFTGYVSEDEKRSIVAQASCFVFAAEDDFGIGPVEALSLGVPVITLKRGGIQEVIDEGKNGLFFPEPELESLVRSLAAFRDTGVSGDRASIRRSALACSQQRFEEQITKVVADA